MGWEKASSHKGGVAAKCERENGRVLQPACLLLRGRCRPARAKKPRNQRARQAAAAIAVPDPGGPPPYHAAVAKRGREGGGGVRRENRRGGGRKELNRARVPGIISRVSPPFETATALGQREGFVVQDRVGMFSRCRMFFSLSVRLRMVWGQGKEMHPTAARVLCGRGRSVVSPRPATGRLCAGVLEDVVTRVWRVATVQEVRSTLVTRGATLLPLPRDQFVVSQSDVC